METIVFWAFTLYCKAECPARTDAVQTNSYLSATSFDGCVNVAKSLLRIRGLSGQWEIECKPYTRTVVVRSHTGG